MKSPYLTCLLSTLCITSCLQSAQSNPTTPSSSTSSLSASNVLVLGTGAVVSVAGVVAGGKVLFKRHQIKRLNNELREACERRDESEIVRLLKAKADPNHKLMVDACISFGIQRNMFEEEFTLLDHILVKFKVIEPNLFKQRMTVKCLLVSGRATTNYTNRFKRTPLHYNLHPRIASLFLEHGALVNARDQFGRTPLHEAARHGNHKTVQALIEKEAVCDAKDDEGRTPLDLIINSTPGTHRHACISKFRRALQIKQRTFGEELADMHQYVCEALDPDIGPDEDIVLNIDAGSVIGEYVLGDLGVLTSNPAPADYIDPTDTHIQRWVDATIEKRKRRKKQLQALGATVVTVAAAAAVSTLNQSISCRSEKK